MILVTGATGFLGREILARLLILHPERHLAVLLRPGVHVSAEARIEDTLCRVFGAELAAAYTRRIHVFAGDITAPQLGLDERQFGVLSSELTAIYHCAADTNLNHSLEQKRKVNVGGTYQVLKLAEAAARASSCFRFYHISTAYVAGSRTGIVAPDELDLNTKFRNAYEQTKAEAEALVRSMTDLVHTTIFRPSIIVGDSITGETSAFNVLYIPARLLISGLLKALPAFPHTPFDVVPVDYVADAIIKLSANQAETGTCYHVSAGLGRESTIHEVLDLLFSSFSKHAASKRREVKRPLFIAPELLTRAFSSLSSAAAHSLQQLEKAASDHINIFKQVLPMIPYMLGNPRFDAADTHCGLVPPPPLFKTYADRLFHYCFETDWGKKPSPSVGNPRIWTRCPALEHNC